MRSKAVSGILICLALLLASSCRSGGPGDTPPGQKRLKVVASLFPLYDFAKNVGKDKTEVTLLMPPGMEPHSFEPKPADIMLLNKTAIFIYTNRYMEPWAAAILKGLDNNALVVVDSSKGLELIRETEEEHHHEAGHEAGHEASEGMDPHVWLDFSNAMKMVDTIADAFAKKDPANGDYYRTNAEAYKAQLAALDKKFVETLSRCAHRKLVSGGHNTFGYLARRYNLEYVSAYRGFSADAEPTSKDLIALTKIVRRHGLSHIFHEELISPRIAETISRETGAGLLMLHGAHNIGKEDLQKGVKFLSLMNGNLENLRKGLQCK